MKLTPLFLCGPTASGKSSVALALAEALDGEIVNADAFQLYRGLEVITAAPSAQEQTLAPHHLYGIADPSASHDAASYLSLATPVIDEIASRGRLPIVVGGSGLYLKFLTHGPSPLPPADPALRRELEKQALPDLYARLQELDPEGAARIDPQNPHYVQRALEICLLTGQAASVLRDSFDTVDESTLRGVLLQWERPTLHQRIALRTEQMLSQGALEEVAQLTKISPTTTKAIGIREIQAHLSGESTLDQCAEKIATATRQYAKRQESWFRREKWLHAIPGETTHHDFAAKTREILSL